MSIRFRILLFLAFSLVLISVFAAYQQGKTGSLFYDDLSNLSALSEIKTITDVRNFVFGGNAGPLGRPLSLVTFLPHAEQWPASSSYAILINIVIHLVNGFLLLGIGYLLLSRCGRLSKNHSMAAAVMAVGLWMVMPLLASTTLIVVQRMTGLASLFGLMGMLGYLALSEAEDDENVTRFFLKMAVLFGFTALAALSKENAVVFPLYVLLADCLLPRRDYHPGFYNKVRVFALFCYLIVLVGYLLYKMPADLFAVNPSRGFSLFERVSTQPLILWDYLRLALVPSLNEYGPFHDDVKVASSYSSSLIAVGGFVVVLAAGVWLRKKFPFLLFAVLWFFIGHLVESGVIMLELYFEHRNYIAIYGFCLMLAAAVFMVGHKFRRIMIGAFCAYAVLNLVILAMLANIWGKPLEAAEHWATVKPTSSRAIMALSESYFKSSGSPAYANAALDRGLDTCSDCLDIYMQALVYGCMGEADEKINDRYKSLIGAAPTGHFTPAMLDGIYPVREFITHSTCGSLKLDDIEALLLVFQRNPSFKSTANRIHLVYLKAVNAVDQKNWGKALRYLDELSTIQTIFNAVVLKAHVLQYSEGTNSSLAYLKQIEEDPGNIGDIRRAEWDLRLRGVIRDVKRQAKESKGETENE